MFRTAMCNLSRPWLSIVGLRLIASGISCRLHQFKPLIASLHHLPPPPSPPAPPLTAPIRSEPPPHRLTASPPRGFSSAPPRTAVHHPTALYRPPPHRLTVSPPHRPTVSPSRRRPWAALRSQVTGNSGRLGEVFAERGQHICAAALCLKWIRRCRANIAPPGRH